MAAVFTIKLLGGVIKPTKNNMSTFKERLVDEKTQLDEKIEKLEAFTLSANFKKKLYYGIQR